MRGSVMPGTLSAQWSPRNPRASPVKGKSRPAQSVLRNPNLCLHPNPLTLSRFSETLAAPSPMEIRKALITAAGKNQRMLPLQSLVDRDGITKTALAIIIEEIQRAGIEQIGVVITPGDEAAYRNAAGAHAGKLTFIEQPAPL